MATIELASVTKRFRSETVLNDVSFSVAEGETLVLFGPSGAGKTVLLRLIAGVVDPDQGSVQLHGQDVGAVPPERRGVGMAFQNFALFPHLSSFDNIASPLEAKGGSRTSIRAGVEKVAKLLKIDHVLGHAPRALSNGQKQRTALARALAASPSILLLDDPLRNVDAKLRFEMRLELPRLLAEQGATVIYVTQDYKEAMALGDRIAVLDRGRIIQLGTPEQVYLTPNTIQIASLFGDPTINLLDVRPERDGSGPFVRLSDLRVPLAPELAHTIGRDCKLGIRPAEIGFTSAGSEGAIPVTIEAETPLNEKVVTLVTTARGREILVSRPSGTAGAADPCHIRFRQNSVLLFDRDTGERLPPDETTLRHQGQAA
ncbi:MAG: ABC transporter ATP-binding protein [Geminicoccaceae bacterium]